VAECIYGDDEAITKRVESMVKCPYCGYESEAFEFKPLRGE
jgi:hypothetical protein